MAGSWRTVRIFISSTFRDMHAERDHLVKETFPRLRQWCEEHRLHLFDIDLRWGVTRDVAENGRAIEVCLRAIDGCRPFFISLLGERYGYVPERMAPGLSWRSQGGDQSARPSITQLEIVHAVLDPLPGRDGSPVPPCTEAFFYFRQLGCVPDPASIPGLTDEKREEIRKAYFETDPSRSGSLADLKLEVRRRYEAEGRVFEYCGQWDPDAENPEETALKGRLTDLGAFGDHVEADLKRAIQRQFPAHFLPPRVDSPIEDERSSHEIFIESRLRAHIPRSDVEQLLTDYTLARDPTPLILSGPPGSGKSAILAHWVNERIGRSEGTGGEEFLMPKFVGASPGSTSLPRLLSSICLELRERFALSEQVLEEIQGPSGEKETVTVERTMEIPLDPVMLAQKWPRFLEAAGAGRRVVLVLDAIEQLDRSADLFRTRWLPRALPEGVRLIVSVTDHGDRPTKCVESGSDGPPYLLAELRLPGWPEVKVPELTDHLRRRVIQEMPGAFAKILDDDQVDLLARNEATRNPLFLNVALEELRVFGSMDRLSDAIANLPRPDGAGAGFGIEESLNQLFGRVTDRLERETNRRAPGLVETLFRLLASARDGLSEAELDGALQRILTAPGPSGRSEVLQVVLRHVRPYLMRKGDRRGALIDFFHRSFREAVLEKYLPDAATQQAGHRALGDYFESQDDWLETPEEQARRARTSPGSPRPSNARKAVELPWQRLQARQWDELGRLLTDPSFLESKAEAGLILDLLGDYSEAGRCMPPDWRVYSILRPIEQALRFEFHFVAEHPTALFQTLWNRCWWYDSPELARHLIPPEGGWPPGGAPWDRPGPKLSTFLESWRAAKERATPGFAWVRSLRPPPDFVGSGQLAVFLGHGGAVNAVAFSPDGKRLASASWDRTIRVWDVATGIQVAVLLGHERRVVGVVFSRDGQKIISASADGTVRSWEAGGGYRELALFRATERKCPLDEDKRLEGIADLGPLLMLQGGVRCLAGSPVDDRVVLGTGDGSVLVWDPGTGAEVARFEGESSVCSVCFSPSGRHITAGMVDNSVRSWSLDDAPEESVFEDLKSYVNSVVYSPDGGRILAGAYDGKLVLRAAGGVEPLEIDVRPNRVLSVLFSPEGRRILAGLEDGTIRAWDVSVGREVMCYAGHTKRVRSITYSPDGTKLASAGGDWTVRVWDVSPAAAPGRLRDHAGTINNYALSPDGRLLATASDDASVYVWDPTSGVFLRSLESHEDEVNCIAFSQDGLRLASGGEDQTIRIWNPTSGEELLCIGGSKGRRTEELRRHQQQDSTFRTFRAIGARPHRPIGLVFSPDGGKIAAQFADNKLAVWELPGGAELSRPAGHKERVECLAFSPDGRRLASGGADRTIVIWDASSGKRLARLRRQGTVDYLAFSQDGRLIVSGSDEDDTVRVWDPARRSRLAAYRNPCPCGERHRVLGVALSKDGTRVYSRWNNATFLIWKAFGGFNEVWLRGFGDTQTIADGGPPRPWGAWGRGSDVVIFRIRAEDGPIVHEELAWFMPPLDGLRAHPSGQIWSGAVGHHLYLFALEGPWGVQPDDGDGQNCAICSMPCRWPAIRLREAISVHASCFTRSFGPAPPDGVAGEVPCLCCRRTGEPMAARTPIGQVCATCCCTALEQLVDRENLDAWSGSPLTELLSTNADIYLKFVALRRLPEIIAILEGRDSPGIDVLLRDLVHNLGYEKGYPLSSAIRRASHEACLAAGRRALPALLDLCQDEPWDYYANVVLTAGSIDPGLQAVRTLLKRASRDLRPEVRLRVPFALADHKASWTRRLLRKMISDEDASVREAAGNVLTKWGQEAWT